MIHQWPVFNLSFIRHLFQAATFFRSLGQPLYTGLTIVVKIILSTFSINFHQNIYFQQNTGQAQQVSMIGKSQIQTGHPYNPNSYSCKKNYFYFFNNANQSVFIMCVLLSKWFSYKSINTLSLLYYWKGGTNKHNLKNGYLFSS